MEHEVPFFIVVIATRHCFYPEPDETSQPLIYFFVIHHHSSQTL